LVCHLISSIAKNSIATDIWDPVPVCEWVSMICIQQIKKEKKTKSL
jgi:hypothetical protein